MRSRCLRFVVVLAAVVAMSGAYLVVPIASAGANVSCQEVLHYSTKFDPTDDNSIYGNANAGGSCAGAWWTRVSVCLQWSDDNFYWTVITQPNGLPSCTDDMRQCIACDFLVATPKSYGAADGYYRVQVKVAQYDSGVHFIAGGTYNGGKIHL